MVGGPYMLRLRPNRNTVLQYAAAGTSRRELPGLQEQLSRLFLHYDMFSSTG
jgi:hypothetical protein